MGKAMTVLLHGFWGRPQDWNEVLRGLPLNVEVHAPDLYEDPVLSPGIELKDWVKHFVNWCESRGAGAPVDLVGYSMGGRLALQALLQHPRLFRRALILSANPEIPRQEHKDREAWENQWAEKFQTQPWIELESAWQEQSVFTGSRGVARRRKDELREKLAQSLINWSPRRHLAGLEEVKALSPAVEWAFGALDQKYVEVAKTLASLPVQGQINIIPNAGHRLFTDAADFIVRWIENRGHT
jgi:2-succinyl-6-hydroxy-2,4-cyclohexadiene-1-carboxylate synthase